MLHHDESQWSIMLNYHDAPSLIQNHALGVKQYTCVHQVPSGGVCGPHLLTPHQGCCYSQLALIVWCYDFSINTKKESSWLRTSTNPHGNSNILSWVDGWVAGWQMCGCLWCLWEWLWLVCVVLRWFLVLLSAVFVILVCACEYESGLVRCELSVCVSVLLFLYKWHIHVPNQPSSYKTENVRPSGGDN